MKKWIRVLSAVIIVIFMAGIALSSFAAEAKKPASNTGLAATPQKQGQATVQATMPRQFRPNFSIATGTITKIDNSDPANTKLEIKSSADNTIRTFAVTSWTNVTKVTDLAELKPGETVRIISRKVDDKDVAMGVVFGKLQTTMPPGPMAPVPAIVDKRPVTPPAPKAVKK